MHMRWVCALAIGFVTRTASAESVQGTVLRVDAQEVVLDVGGGQLLSNGDVLELWRPYRVKHPVTGRSLEDRFRIGSVKIVQVRPTMSLAQPDGTLAHGVQSGDLVLKGSITRPATTVDCPPPVPQDPEAKNLASLFDGLAGSAPLIRAQKYLAWVSEHPRSRFTPVLREEADALRRTAPKREPRTDPDVVSFEPATEAYANEPLWVTIELERAQGAVLYVRNPERLAYVPLRMQSIGKGYFSVPIGADLVTGGWVEYFIEAIGEHGDAFVVQGTAANPVRSGLVDRPAALPPQPVLVTAAIWSDFAAFNVKKANDWVSQTEGVLGVRLQDIGIRAIRTGFGVYRGVGGTLDELDRRQLAPRTIGLTYGYLEGEFAFHTIFSVVVRGIVGLREPGVDGGAQVFFRIGNDRKTNLSLGGEVLGGIGVRGIAQLEWNTLPRVPIVFRSEVTNQPAGIASSPDAFLKDPQSTTHAAGDVGVRVIAQIGYRFTPALVLAVRGSYQGRTIEHAGPGGGAALVYEW